MIQKHWLDCHLIALILTIFGQSEALFASTTHYAIQVPKSYRNRDAGTVDISVTVNTPAGSSREQFDPNKDQVVFLLAGGPGNSNYLINQPIGDGPPLNLTLSKTYHVVSIHRRGSPRSPMTVQDLYNPEFDQVMNFVHDIHTIQKELYPRAAKVHLFGHSYGGIEALIFAGTYPDRIASVTMQNSHPDFSIFYELLNNDLYLPRLLKRYVSLYHPDARDSVKLEHQLETLLIQAANARIATSPDEENSPLIPRNFFLNYLAVIFMQALAPPRRFYDFLTDLANNEDYAHKIIRREFNWFANNDNGFQRQFLICYELLQSRSMDPIVRVQINTCKTHQILPPAGATLAPVVDFQNIYSNVLAAKLPIQFVYGDLDLVSPQSSVVAFQKAIPNGGVHLIRGANHLSVPMFPSDTARILIDHIERSGESLRAGIREPQ